MKIIDFGNPSNTLEAYNRLVYCVSSGFEYEPTYRYLMEIDYYIPEDQFKVFEELFNIMVEMDIGDRVLGL